MALAHAIGDKVEAAYRRGELMEKRRKPMMEQWAQFLRTTARVQRAADGKSGTSINPVAQRRRDGIQFRSAWIGRGPKILIRTGLPRRPL